MTAGASALELLCEGHDTLESAEFGGVMFHRRRYTPDRAKASQRYYKDGSIDMAGLGMIIYQLALTEHGSRMFTRDDAARLQKQMKIELALEIIGWLVGGVEEVEEHLGNSNGAESDE